MFNSAIKKDASNGKPAPSASPAGGHSLNSIVQGTHIEGTVKADSDIRIDGSIKGNLNCDAKVIIGPTGKIVGEVRCQNAVIEGRFEGTISVKELLNVRETASLQGEITCGKLIVQPGGVMDGTINMTGGKSIAGTANREGEKNVKVAG